MGFNRKPLSDNPPTHGSVNQGQVGLQFTQAPATYVATEYPGWVYIFVTDVDSLAARYRATGVFTTREPTSYDYGLREFDSRDLNGYTLRFGQYLTDA